MKKRFQQLAGIESNKEDKLRTIVKESLSRYLGEEEEKEEEDTEDEGGDEELDLEDTDTEGEPEFEDLGLGDGIEDPTSTVQDALTQAYEAASALGDEKLMSQIGNTITFFTRNHIVKSPDEQGAV